MKKSNDDFFFHNILKNKKLQKTKNMSLQYISLNIFFINFDFFKFTNLEFI